MMRPCVAAHALSTVVLAALLHAQADLHRTSDDGSIKRPVEAPLRMRLFNPRAGDPRRRVGDLLTPEDLELKVSVAQAVQGKNIGATKADYAFVGYMPQKGYMGTMWRKAKGETNLFDPFRRGEIVALRRGEILGVMSKRPALCERKNSWRAQCQCGARSAGSGVGAGPTANADCLHTQCIRRIRWCPPNRHSDPARSCPMDQSCKTWNDLHEDGCEYTMNDQTLIEKNCRGALSGRAVDRAEVVHRSVLHYLNMCNGVDSSMGWKYNWCTTIARYWKKDYVFPTHPLTSLPTFNASDGNPNPWDPTRTKLVCKGDPAQGTGDVSCAQYSTFLRNAVPSEAECKSAKCVVEPESVTCKKAFERDSCSDTNLNSEPSCTSHGAGNCAWDKERSRCGFATWRSLCKTDDNNRKVGNVDPMTQQDELEPEIDAPVCVGKPELLCLPTTPVGIAGYEKGACLPAHCAPWLMGTQQQNFNVSLVEPFMPTRYSEREKHGPAPDRYSDEDRQQAGTMELPGAGVDYNRPDIVHEIRYGELDSYNAETGMFTVIVEKKYNKVSGAFQFG